MPTFTARPSVSSFSRPSSFSMPKPSYSPPKVTVPSTPKVVHKTYTKPVSKSPDFDPINPALVAGAAYLGASAGRGGDDDYTTSSVDDGALPVLVFAGLALAAIVTFLFIRR